MSLLTAISSAIYCLHPDCNDQRSFYLQENFLVSDTQEEDYMHDWYSNESIIEERPKKPSLRALRKATNKFKSLLRKKEPNASESVDLKYYGTFEKMDENKKRSYFSAKKASNKFKSLLKRKDRQTLSEFETSASNYDGSEMGDMSREVVTTNSIR